MASGTHGDYFRALAGAKSVSKQIEYMKEFGSAAPVLPDAHSVSDLNINVQIVQEESITLDAVSVVFFRCTVLYFNFYVYCAII